MHQLCWVSSCLIHILWRPVNRYIQLVISMKCILSFCHYKWHVKNCECSLKLKISTKGQRPNLLLKLSKKAHTSSFCAFLLCPKKGQILHDSSCGTWATTTFLSSQGPQKIKLDNSSKFVPIGQSTDHTTMSLGQVKCCIVTRSFYPHERVEFGHETTWPLHSSTDFSLY